MDNSLLKKTYNPDVLSCLANLSNDEVFTPPQVANKMLDMLPKELWSNSNAKFLDPACKSGVFLREIAKRLLEGLAEKIPDLQKRIDHIFHNQLYGIAITELTSLLSRRSVYCSKYPNCKYSVSHFDTQIGNIFFTKTKHTWNGDKCIYCGASKKELDRGEEYETHAYQFIHNAIPEEIKKMKFDVIISNPPYQLGTGGGSAQATPLYNKFIDKSIVLKPRYVVMIIPARWYAGGMGLDSFRKEMLSNNHIRELVDYANAKECFPSSSIGGGVCYFLWDRDNLGDCKVINITSNKKNIMKRKLDEYEVFIRYNEAIEIIKKIRKVERQYISEYCSPLSPFCLSSAERGQEKKFHKSLRLYSSKGIGYIEEKKIAFSNKYLNEFKVMISKTTAEHAGEPDKNGTYKVLSTIRPLAPGEVCTFSYFLIDGFENEIQMKNAITYLKTKFTRFLVLQAVSSINLSKEKFQFVPLQDFTSNSDIDWTKSVDEIDAQLYAKYNLTHEEIAFIESMIKPMDIGGGTSDAE